MGHGMNRAPELTGAMETGPPRANPQKFMPPPTQISTSDLGQTASQPQPQPTELTAAEAWPRMETFGRLARSIMVTKKFGGFVPVAPVGSMSPPASGKGK